MTGNTLGQDAEGSAAQLAALAALGLDLDVLGGRLQSDGLAQFETAFAKLLELTA